MYEACISAPIEGLIKESQTLPCKQVMRHEVTFMDEATLLLWQPKFTILNTFLLISRPIPIFKEKNLSINFFFPNSQSNFVLHKFFIIQILH